jgi:periplasmic protein TonB
MLRHLTRRTFQLALFYLICVASGYAQTTTKSYGHVYVEITKKKKPKRIYTKVEIKSAFTGGDSSWTQSLEKTLNQSIHYKNGAKAGKYIVSVIFVVDKEGNISDIRCVNDPPGFRMAEEVLRAIKKKARWLPSSQGIPVRPYRTSSSAPTYSNLRC